MNNYDRLYHDLTTLWYALHKVGVDPSTVGPLQSDLVSRPLRRAGFTLVPAQPFVDPWMA